MVVGNINAVFADGDISVRMNEIVSNDVSYNKFYGYETYTNR